MSLAAMALPPGTRVLITGGAAAFLAVVMLVMGRSKKAS